MEWTILLDMSSLIIIILPVLYHLILRLDEALPLVLRERQGSVHDEDRHDSPVTPECPVEPEVVQEERVELDGSKHIDSIAGTTDTRGVRSEQIVYSQHLTMFSCNLISVEKDSASVSCKTTLKPMLLKA